MRSPTTSYLMRVSSRQTGAPSLKPRRPDCWLLEPYVNKACCCSRCSIQSSLKARQCCVLQCRLITVSKRSECLGMHCKRCRETGRGHPLSTSQLESGRRIPCRNWLMEMHECNNMDSYHSQERQIFCNRCEKGSTRSICRWAICCRGA